MSGHTPGPWHVFARPDTDTFAVFGPDNDPRHPVVEWLGFDATLFDLGATTVEANARLTAAAPELLGALEMVRDADDDNKADGGVGIPPMARAKIDAAIRKATEGE